MVGKIIIVRLTRFFIELEPLVLNLSVAGNEPAYWLSYDKNKLQWLARPRTG
jgi:hypothetical protein